MALPPHVRPIDPTSTLEVELVAQRMRQTLIEVLGQDRGRAMYTMEWLTERVRWHLDPQACVGQVFLAEAADGPIAGHTIVRVDADAAGHPIGLFSTFYVAPAFRRQGVAVALLARGEAWMREQGMTRAVTHTSDANDKLIRLCHSHGYLLTPAPPEMVKLEKQLGIPA